MSDMITPATPAPAPTTVDLHQQRIQDARNFLLEHRRRSRLEQRSLLRDPAYKDEYEDARQIRSKSVEPIIAMLDLEVKDTYALIAEIESETP